MLYSDTIVHTHIQMNVLKPQDKEQREAEERVFIISKINLGSVLKGLDGRYELDGYKGDIPSIVYIAPNELDYPTVAEVAQTTNEKINILAFSEDTCFWDNITLVASAGRGSILEQIKENRDMTQKK